MVDIRDFEPNAVLDYKVVVVMAVRGEVEDWAAYWAPVDPDVPNLLTPTQILDRGYKLPENAAKNDFFPNIGGGPYRS